MARKIKPKPELFFPFGPFKFFNEKNSDELEVIIEEYRLDKNKNIIPIREGGRPFTNSDVKMYFEFKFSQLDSLKILAFLENLLKKSPNQKVFLEYLEDFFKKEKYILSQPNNNPLLSQTERNVFNSTRIIKVDKALSWISFQKRYIERLDELKEELTDILPSNDWGYDLTAFFFLLLGRFGIIKIFANKTKFGGLIEEMTVLKKKKLAEKLTIKSEEDFYKTPNARKKIALLITTLKNMVNYLENEKERLE